MKQIKLYEQVEETLAEEIANGVYQPGDALPTERELMERFDVGRPSVREALFSLSRRGLIEAGSGRRPRVLQPSFNVVLRELNLIVRQVLNSPENIVHLMEIRRLLESALARKAAVEATDTQIAELKSRLEANRQALGYLQKFWETDTAFHAAIARMSGNPITPTVIDAVLEWLIDNRRVTVSEVGSDERAYHQHKAIFEAIAARDPDKAEAAMEAHLLYVERQVALQLVRRDSARRSVMDDESEGS
ncbi:FCD domain-containing protein [Pelagibius sp. Alg239-R121]|uniref:FCD domain-containing protein n=1 Tax=Pelagibius sp. Alg239-R121 TaxID=2993448 RepID=UPI0024A70BBE|nr:FCD domain-containing protein [Pelagibius sp. Alg239-R121]